MFAVIKEIEPNSPASHSRLSVGDSIVAVSGKPVHDVLDYKFFTYEKNILIQAQTPDGKQKLVRIKKAEGQDIGLVFETYLMDKAHACSNRCIFCFVDQMPRGMRKTLYFKDDDARLSFLLGNYITLTNLSDREAQRIIDLHISPINVSVHTTNPELRKMMLGNPNAGKSIDLMRRFAEAGITMNCQIVCCPGVNDKDELERSMRDLSDMYPSVCSVSIVPVGVTKFREKLHKLTPFTPELAKETIEQVERFSAGCFERFGTRIFYCADELYLKAGLPIPDDEFYEDYAQLENGVGMMRLLFTEFEAEMEASPVSETTPLPFALATGVIAAPFMQKLIDKIKERYPAFEAKVYPIVNDFFGHTIDVAGLVTGGDLIAQLKGKQLYGRLLLPPSMIRHGETVFLDDVTIEDAERELGVKIIVTESDGGKLYNAMTTI